MTSRRVVQGLALLALLTLGLGVEAAGPPAPLEATVLVILRAPTRWDAWQAARDRFSGARPMSAASEAPSRAAREAAILIANEAHAVERLALERGGHVLSRYDTALSGLLVRLPRDAVADLADLPQVTAVAPAPLVAIDLRDSVPGIGADRVARDLGLTGELATIAVVDTGIDYTHAAFGGPGTPEAYDAAAAAAERIDDTWQGRPLFPTRRIVAGHDFAGPKYSPDCSPPLEAQGACTSTPQPDPDPLDTIGHGTTVADIAAGSSTEALAAGVAPEARLVALKIFGNSNLTDLLIDPIEWAIEANMGEGGRPRIDVMNLSLGQPYGAGLAVEEDAIRRAVEAGIVVVASAGNHGAVPFIASAPGIAPDAISVASYVPPGRHDWSAILSHEAGGDTSFGSSALYLQGWSPDPGAPVSGRVVHAGRACPAGSSGRPADPLPDLPAGAIALFDMAWGSAGPDCTVDVQARRLQDAGAAAALMGAGISLPVAASWDARPTVDIPVWMVNHDLETAIEEMAAPGSVAQLTITPVPMPDADRVLSAFSSLGPGRNGALKPDLAGPGQGVFAAAIGQGHRGASRTGTSVAAPHASGTAALVWHHARSRGWPIDARDVAAALITTARPSSLQAIAARPGAPSASRAGQGELDAWGAATTETFVRSGPAASVSLGVHALTAPTTWQRSVTVTNRADAQRTYGIGATYRSEGDRERGLSVSVQPAELSLGPGASAVVTVGFQADPARLPAWRLTDGETTGDADALADAEIDGWIEVLQEGAGDGVGPGVPFSLLARPASAISATWPALEGSSGASSLELRNESPFPGSAEVYVLGATDAHDPSLPGSADLDAVAVRAWPDGQGNTFLEFALHARAPHAHPLENTSEVQIDTDGDGRADYIAYTIDEATLATGEERNGRVKIALEPPSGSPFGSPVSRFYGSGGIHSRWIGLRILAEDIGLTPSRLAFHYRAVRRSLVERLTDGTTAVDEVPSDGAWIAFDGRQALPWPVPPAAALDGWQRRDLPVPTDGLPGTGMVAWLPLNPPGPADISLQAPPDRPRQRDLYLPSVLSGSPQR